ncbi:hypothetical protein ACFWWT_41870 [Streptomyces sp. NPDC058676]|uniref:hypothetical protein n=1 Tax=unclassified Streptomyces TaxID=2593676 RepID=UPI00365CFF5C
MTRPAARPWHFDKDVLDAQAAADGWYALLTNLSPEQASAQEVFLRYEGQGLVERPHHDFKGPLAVAPCSCSTTAASLP